MSQALEITVTVKRGDQAHTYALAHTGESRGGTWATYQPTAGNTELAEFGKLYVSLGGKPQSAHGKTRKSERAAAKKHAPTPTAAPTPAGTPQTTAITLADVQKLITQALKATK